MSLYCVCIFFRGRRDVVEDGSPDLWEESFVLFNADEQREAVAKAESWARTREVAYPVTSGGRVTWRADRSHGPSFRDL